MNSKMTRREFLRYAGMGAGAIALASCGAPQRAPQAPTVAATPKPPAGPELLTLPIVKEPLTLTYWVELNPNAAASMKTYGEMACYQELEKRTGLHIEFQHPPVGQAQEQFSLTMASQKYPDIIEHGWGGEAGGSSTPPGGPAKYLKDGVIIRLNELIDKYAPNFRKLLADHPDWRKQIVTDEGDIYGFPFIRGDPYLQTYQGPILRGDWLEKLGLQAPTTLDEWHTVLKAIKEKDPNGNGKADEWPFNSFRGSGPAHALNGFSNHAFVGAWGIGWEFYQEKGAVKYGPLQPEFKEFLKVMAQWFKEGLIDPDFVAMDRKLLDAKVTGSQLGSLVGNAGANLGVYMDALASKEPKFKLVGAPYPVLKKGDKPVLGQYDFAYTGVAAAITTANQHVAETVKWLDYAYSPEGHLLFNFGVEGVSYKMEGGYPKYTDEILKNPEFPVARAMPRYFRSSMNGPFVQDRRYIEQYYGYPEQTEALKLWSAPSNEMQIPRTTPTQEESKRFATIMTDVGARRDEVVIKIIMGAQPVEAWDQAVQQLKQMGIEEAVKVQQAALDRYNKR